MSTTVDPLTVIHGDALSSLRSLPDGSVQCCVTSPPYWGLRDYGTGKWIGGDSECDHVSRPQVSEKAASNRGALRDNPYKHECGKCGAQRVDIQIGLEQTPELYVQHVVEIFREMKRVLRGDGVLWLNLGDSYAGGGRGGNPDESPYRKQATNAGSVTGVTKNPWPVPTNCKPKDLVGIPWMVAFALRADGWYLRSDIIWSKPNPMPESVTDRPTKSHEYIFLLSKSERYYYDQEAIKEPGSLNVPWAESSNGGEKAKLVRNDGGNSNGLGKPARRTDKQRGHGRRHAGFNDRWDAMERAEQCSGLRNKRSVWTIATRPFPEAHFATFPRDLVEPCILAGSRPAGKRCDCNQIIETPLGSGGDQDPTMQIGRAGFSRSRGNDEGTRPITRREQRAYAQQIKASPHRAEMATEASTAFEHYIRTDRSGARPVPPALLNAWRERGWLTEPEPCRCPTGEADTVIDPFAGSGTTGKVAIELGRKAILIEPKAEYVEMIKRRCQTTIGLPLTI